MCAYAQMLGPQYPGRTVIATVDTDLVALFMVHGGPSASVCLMHHEQRNRMCIDTAVLSKALAAPPYRLSVSEFVIVSAVKGTDFTPKAITGLPDWHATLCFAGRFLRASSRPIVEDGVLCMIVFDRMVNDIVLSSPRAKAAKLTKQDRDSFTFIAQYWLKLHDPSTKTE